MVCPYLLQREAVRQVTNDLDLDGREIGWQQIETEKNTPMPCLKEQCAAWQDGVCRYNGGR